MKKSNLILLIIALNAFVIGLTEFISVGLIPMFVADFGINESTASLAVTFYAIGVIIGAPLLSVATTKLNRKHVMLLVMTIFVAGNLIVLTAPAFPILILGRFVSAFAHGLFMTVASIIAAGVIEESKKSSAIAIMFTGLTVATIFGVPFGTFLAAFFSWRMTFLIITLLGAIIFIVDLIFIPNNIESPVHSKLAHQLAVFKSPQVLIVFLITALAYGSTFIIYTFISPLLANVGFSQLAITIILFLYGVMVAIGNTIGGKLTNDKPLSKLQTIIFGQAISFILIALTINNKYLLLLATIVMGLFAFMNVAGLQLAVLNRATTHTPRSIDLATALNISAFNLGIAGGSFIGGLIYVNLNSLMLGVIAAIIAIVAVIIIKLSKAEFE